MKTLGEWLLNWVKWLDEGLNVSTGGAENETVSARAAKARNAGRHWGCILCRILDFIQKDHCDDALKAKIGDDAIIPDGE